MVSVVLNLRTGRVYESTNGPHGDTLADSEVHPKLKALSDELEGRGPYKDLAPSGELRSSDQKRFPGPDKQPFKHAEVRATNAHLHVTEEDGEPIDVELSDLLAETWFTRAGGVRSAPFCATCSGLLHGVHSREERLVYHHEDGGQLVRE